ncbi:MAG: hypothetical protein ABJM69_22360, partial [Nitratireductor sp.]
MNNDLFAHEKERAAKDDARKVLGLPEISRDAMPCLGGREVAILAIGPRRNMHPARQPCADLRPAIRACETVADDLLLDG